MNNKYEDHKDLDCEVITLSSPDGEDIDFAVLSRLQYNDFDYVLLQELDSLEKDMPDIYFFMMTQCEDGTIDYFLEEDEDIKRALFSEYIKIYDED